MDRRYFVKGCGASAGLGMMALAGCARQGKAAVAAAATAPPFPFYDAVQALPPIRADLDRVFKTTVCLRPFRAAGPRYDVVKVGDKTVFCNYGHGGSGWSLSWGSADYVMTNVMKNGSGTGEVAIIGCGALGMTAGLTAQRAGLKATIYAKERPPYVRSVRATGSWSPDTRIALTGSVSPDFAAAWEKMARTTFAMYASYMGVAGHPIEFTDHYALSDADPASPPPPALPGSHDYVKYIHDRIPDLLPLPHEIPAGHHPFPVKRVVRTTSLTYNVSDYARQLMADFQLAGGKIETREFHSPADFSSLPQRDIVSCTGYGSRELWSDESIVPVRGQIQWLVPQPGQTYGINYRGLGILKRRDGIGLQYNPPGVPDNGWNETNEVPDRETTVTVVGILQELYSRMEKMQTAQA
jgi:D-amino-acid oxidase